MTYSVHHIADWFLGRLNTDAGDNISQLKLQKLIYYAQAWHLVFNNKPLFNEKIEAWPHGPAVRCIFERFKDTSGNITNNTDISLYSSDEECDFCAETEELLERIHRSYGEHSAGYLEALTHSEAPWINARKGLLIYQKSDKEITHQTMKNYYKKKYKNGEKKI
jgi:uncharacterized phage-associated protein